MDTGKIFDAFSARGPQPPIRRLRRYRSAEDEELVRRFPDISNPWVELAYWDAVRALHADYQREQQAMD